MREIVSIPNASRTFEALRSLGYDLNSAIADIVDNSITEKVSANRIHINLALDHRHKVSCYIQDNGCGMNAFQLEEAMRLGTDTTYEENDLGKFGMGMKTASLSHCNSLTVISKQAKSISGYRWDIDHVRKKGWVLLELSSSEIIRFLEGQKINIGNQGTLVIWNDLFWIDKEMQSYRSEKLAQNFFFRLLESLKLHLRMVYHRFLGGQLGEPIELSVNGEVLAPWDPFCRQEPLTERIKLAKHLSELKIPGFSSPILIDAYVLPNKESFSSEDEWKLAKGLLSWNDSQGYYIYRANRIIRFGGWHGTKAKDEHDKLARVSIDIDSSLDRLFRITVNKTKVQLPELLFQHLKNVVNPVIVKKAKSKYNRSDENLVVKNTFRSNRVKISRASMELVSSSRIKIGGEKSTYSGNVEVQNPSGSWLSNKMSEFLKYGKEEDFEIVSANLDDGSLWKIVCSQNEKFKVVINARHSFYSRMYKKAANRNLTAAIDALIFSLAFAELYNRNNQNAQLFDTFKAVCARVLKKLIKDEIL